MLSKWCSSYGASLYADSQQSLGTKWTLHPLPTLKNIEPVPQVLKQVVNLSCLFNSSFFNVLDGTIARGFQNIRN